MAITSFAQLDSPERLQSILAERGYYRDDAPADKLFDLPPDQIGLLRGAKIIALAGPSPDDNTLVVLWVLRPTLPMETLRRIRRKLAESTRDGLIFCAQSWQDVTLYLLRQEDLPQPGQEHPSPDKVPTWEHVNFSALRPADRQGLAMLDISNEDPYDLGKPLLRAFRRAQRETIYQNQGLFSNYYLNERLEIDDEAHNRAWRDLAAAMPALRPQIESALAEGTADLDLAQTESRIISPLLSALGWNPNVKSAKGQIDLRLGGITVAFCHMLPWNTPLDAAPLPTEILTPLPPSPDMQLIGKLSDQKSVLWGILTNGRVWRLLSRQATSTSGVFYEIDLQDLLEVGALDGRDLRWFKAFFGSDWLHAPNGQAGLLDMVYQSGQFWAEKLGNDLKEAIFKDVFVDLANALSEGVRRTGIEPELPIVYRATLVLLYRLLFVLYAESRRLLPLGNPGYYPHSLTYMLSTLALKQNALLPTEGDFSLRTDDPRLWLKLRDLFHAIGDGQPEWNVPYYNGGLFADDTSSAHALLASLDAVANDYLAKGIDRLARDEEARGAKTEHAALRLIDYMDLDVRRLGSIYEGLLEFQLRRADAHGEVINGRLAPVSAKKGRKNSGRLVQTGEAYLETTRQDRKASGSYYTPDYIVRYIVEQTVGPVLEQRAARFDKHMDQARSVTTSIKRSSDSATIKDLRKQLDAAHEAAVEALLDLKVLDPAMGSGHFLVAAVNYLSDQIIAILQRYPENPVLPRLAQVRRAIRENLDEQGISAAIVPDEHLSDRVLLRRMVMKRCIYGVDLNDMAVELAKLSLWLDSFAVGAPLSFLDHHLRWGNSLIGIWDVEQYIAAPSERWNTFMRALGYMVQITRLADSTNDEVQASKELYAKAQETLQPFREQFNVDLAVHFAALGDVGQARRVAHTPPELRDETFALETLAKFADAQQEAMSRHFFHWKIEFPEVFVDHERSDWKAEGTGGFDAVVGNPPYFAISGNLKKVEIDYLKSTYKEVFSGSSDILYYFLYLATRLPKEASSQGFIVARYFQEAKYAQGLRQFLVSHTLIKQIVDFQNFQVFGVEVNVLASIIILLNKVDSKQDVMFIRIKDDKTKSDLISDALLNSPSELFDISAINLPISSDSWVFASQDTETISSKIRKSSISLSNIADVVQSMQTGLNEVLSPGKDTAKDNNLESELLYKVAKSGSILRYGFEEIDRVLIWSQVVDIDKFPHTKKYLSNFRKDLEIRYDILNRKANWWEISNPRNAALFFSDRSRILVPFVATGNKFCVDTEKRLNDGGDIRGIFFKTENAYSEFAVCTLLNSRCLEYYHLGHTKLKRGGYYEYFENQLSQLPIRRIHFTTPDAERASLTDEVSAQAETLVTHAHELPLSRGANGWPRYDASDYRATALGQRIAVLLPQDVQGNFLAFAEGATGEEEHSDVVHDLLAKLAEQMIELNKRKQAEIKRFLGWLEEQLDITIGKDGRDGIDSLKNKTTLQNYLGDYQKNEDVQPWDEIRAVLYNNRKRFVNDYWVVSDMFRPQLQAAYEQSLDVLRPIKEQLARTDALIDQIVYQLYGLTLTDIAIIEGA